MSDDGSKRFIVDKVETEVEPISNSAASLSESQKSASNNHPFVDERKPTGMSNSNSGSGSVGRFAVASTMPTGTMPASPIIINAEEEEEDGFDDQHQVSFDGHRKETMRKHTIDIAPRMDHYRNVLSVEAGMQAVHSRPTMGQLMEGRKSSVSSEDVAGLASELHHEATTDDEAKKPPLRRQPTSQLENIPVEEAKPDLGPRTKFGWVQGVFVRCLLNILGVMLYLRISWMAGQAGVLLSTLIILLASCVTTITSLSMCAIASNGDVKGGGAYFMISRSLGPEFGGSIGVIFSFANAVGAAMYIVGFSETVSSLLKESGITLLGIGDTWDIRLIGIVTLIVLLGICFIGTGFEAKMQIVLLVVLTVSVFNYWVGLFIPFSDFQMSRGATNPKLDLLLVNLLPAFKCGEGFFTVFSVYFPAATGIMAGANISGDLKDPQTAIPKGTLWAIFVTTLVYASTVWFCGATASRYADGNMTTLMNMIDIQNSAQNGTSWYLQEPPCAGMVDQCDKLNAVCPYGLYEHKQVIELTSAWGPLITAGIFAATLSSALASLVSAPKVFQAVCKDNLFPYISFFGKGYGVNEEPKRGFILAAIIALAMVMIGELNAIAPLISNFFLASYALLNYSCFDSSYSESPGFRPAFRYYNMWLSLFGAIICVAVMFLISWPMALITLICVLALYMVVKYQHPEVNWGSSTQAHSYRSALNAMHKLQRTDEHVKNYRPQVLVFTGNPVARPSLVDFVSNITKDNSLLVCAHVFSYDQQSSAVREAQNKMAASIPDWLRTRKVKGFYASMANSSFRLGAQSLMQQSGLGRLKCNIVMLGYKRDWRKCTLAEVEDYTGIIHDAFDMNYGVAVLRLPHGLDFSEMMFQQHVGDLNTLNLTTAHRDSTDGRAAFDPNTAFKNGHEEPICMNDTSDEENETESGDETNQDMYSSEPSGTNNGVMKKKSSTVSPKKTNKPRIQFHLDEKSDDVVETSKISNALKMRRRTRGKSVAQRELLASINQFQRRVKDAHIDVWWLYDDGGLALLVPHIITLAGSYLEGAKLRVFTMGMSKHSLDKEQRDIAALLAKFRIKYTDVFVVPDITKKPEQDTIDEFEVAIKPFMASDKDPNNPNKCLTEEELLANKDKTNRQLRTRELLQQHSHASDLVFITMPVPRRHQTSDVLYMAWLEMLTRDMPPTLLLRGNQQNVLTFYS